MTRAVTPPRLAQRLLARVLPADVRDSVEGDLRELYAERHRMRGARSAALWFWRETASFCVRFTVDRAAMVARKIVGAGDTPSLLDFKLGGRMLVKYPGLAIVGGLGMALATAIGAGGFAWFNSYLYPELPLHEGDRVVAIVNWDTRLQHDNPRVLHDFIAWRRDAATLVDMGAFRTSRRNLIDASGAGEPVDVAELSASGFRVARVAPLIGRFLLDADERPGAAAVAVIAHDVWETRFHGDPSIVGRTIRLGRATHTIVGVMPAGFAFPINHHYWIPLRADPLAYDVGGGPELSVFARLAPHATKRSAQVELNALSQRMVAEHPNTHAHLRPRLVPYTEVFADMDGPAWLVMVLQSVLVLALVAVCANVAILVYARTVTRNGEIAVRAALGATRRRVVVQLFAEAFVLSVLSAIVGLAIAATALRYVDTFVISAMGDAPFWLTPGLSASTIIYTLGLAVLAAVIVGVLPALRATGPQLRSMLGKLSGGSKPQLGRTWTLLIITQVAITVAALPLLALVAWRLTAQLTERPRFNAGEFLATGLLIERDGNPVSEDDFSRPELMAVSRATHVTLIERLRSEPDVANVTFAAFVPGQEWADRFEISGVDSSRLARTAGVGVTFFDVFAMRLLTGRTFVALDVESADRPVVVNRSFAQMFDGDVVGRRLRVDSRSNNARAWSTIVGVVDDHPAPLREPELTPATVYRPIAPGAIQGALLMLKLRGTTPTAFAPRLREIAVSVDPTLQLLRVRSLDAIYDAQRRDVLLLVLMLVAGVGTVVLFSAAGIYSMMSFTVAQRRREIGVRAALGAAPPRILWNILSRAARQLGAGAAGGLTFAIAVDRLSGGAFLSGAGLVLVPAVVAFVLLVGCLAAMGPARSALRIQPTDALRAE